METALRVYSWKGILKESSIAEDIKSRQHARRLGPFCSPDKRGIVTWVRSSWDQGRKKRRAYFRNLPVGSGHEDLLKVARSEIERMQADKSRSTIHNPSRDSLAEALRLHIGSEINWGLKDPEYSDFPVAGNLMAHVEKVETEYTMKTPFGVDYKFDIALLGPVIKDKRVVLAAIELELEHEFESAKCLLSKCLGFPLISLDLKSISPGPVDGSLLLQALVGTTKSTDDGRRINFFYLHPILYPVFLAPPKDFRLEKRHQFLIFAKNERLNKIRKCLESLRSSLELSPVDVVIQPVPRKNSQVAVQFENEGSIAGHDWRSYNEDDYLRITLDRPNSGDRSLFFFHLTMARLVNSNYPSLVGYKYEKSVHNDSPDNPLWTRPVVAPDRSIIQVRIAPKHVSEPIDSILKIIRELR
jgi:hypothetical protein